MLTLELLRRLDSLERLVLPVPDLTGQRHATSYDMNMVVIGILMAHSNPLGIRREAHFFQKIGSNFFPLLAGQPVTGRQSKAAMPHRPLDVFPDAAGMTELGRQ